MTYARGDTRLHKGDPGFGITCQCGGTKTRNSRRCQACANGSGDPRDTRKFNATHKYCPGCNTWLPHSRFAPNIHKPSGLASRCRPCKQQQDRVQGIKRLGITLEDLNGMLERQGNRCAICKATFASPKDVHVDHDHTTGNVRSVLCHRCNTGLGLFRDRPDLLSAAADYVTRHSELRTEIETLREAA